MPKATNFAPKLPNHPNGPCKRCKVRQKKDPNHRCTGQLSAKCEYCQSVRDTCTLFQRKE